VVPCQEATERVRAGKDPIRGGVEGVPDVVWVAEWDVPEAVLVDNACVRHADTGLHIHQGVPAIR
jgi:hypothetical protein